MKRQDFPLYAFCAVMFGAVALVIAADVTTALCQGVDLEKLNEGRPTFGCREFWVNRYQTTTQTVISSLIGGVGLILVLRQLSELGKQNEMTRAALETNIQQQRANVLSAIGRARVALGLHASLASTMMMECLAILGKLPKTPKSPDYEFMNKVTASIADVYPALTSDDLRSEWRKLRKELDGLCIYVISHRTLDNASTVDLAKFHDHMPVSIPDAAAKAIALSGAFNALTAKIDA